MSRNCRDCAACTRPGVIRMLYTVFVLSWAWFFIMWGKPFMKTCPQCRHLLGKHQRRDDGSYID